MGPEPDEHTGASESTLRGYKCKDNFGISLFVPEVMLTTWLLSKTTSTITIINSVTRSSLKTATSLTMSAVSNSFGRVSIKATTSLRLEERNTSMIDLE